MNRRLDESLCELLVCNVAVLDIPDWNRKELMASWADDFETMLLMIKLFGLVWDGWNDYETRAVLLVATDTRSRLGHSHDLPAQVLHRNRTRQENKHVNRIHNKPALGAPSNEMTTVTG
jgi:hypothetical protein